MPTTVVEDLGNGISLELVEIPGGKFWMGSPDGEEGSYNDERPQHEVKVSSFLMGKYPVTQAQWRVVALLDRVERDLNPEPSYLKGDVRRPVESVSWYEAVEFCERLTHFSMEKGQKQKYRYRLPSEAEWEYTCRAGTETSYNFGKKISPVLANYIETARGRTTPVGRFQVANGFGIYDMCGNVFEWCEDHWHDNYEGAPTDGSAWLRKNGNDYRLLRGGSWADYPRYCRSARRYQHKPDDVGSDFYIGLRVVASPRT
jgi:formylglycine-generating enzyme required for sulfatase activity